MRALTPSERRGALIVVLLLALGATRDLVVARHAPLTPPPRSALEPRAVGSAADAGMPPAPGAAPPSPGAPATRLDLNRATAEELDRLPGIGPVLAGRILEHRRRSGPFHSAEELRAVRGVGPRLLERLRPLVIATPTPPTAALRHRSPAGVQSAREPRAGAADSAQVRARPFR